MNIYLNGQLTKLAEPPMTLEHALALYLTENDQQQSFAVAVNSDFVAKAQYAHTQLQEGDSVDVLFPIQGG
ncbi:sulfur carrier protein ThiS [Thalassotalea sp. G2M2-11]|uniref:sulfur carrier protein ThiS n=1 Tax=Thalassotalea sp. G2M2-11 TaxID=2787627 RepID=UPI0019D2B20E|nr:sulfur carrier protein ThiS [Thalassotalea sp. G2M2-11]